MRRPESGRQQLASAQDGGQGAYSGAASTSADSLERQNHLMQAILLLLKELEPGELDLVRHDIDKRLHAAKNRAL